MTSASNSISSFTRANNSILPSSTSPSPPPPLPLFNGNHPSGCYRKILRFSCKNHVTNAEVCAEIKQAVGPHADLLAIVKRRKLK